MPPGRTSCLLALPVELWSIVLAEYDSMALAFAEQICHAALHASRVRTKLKISAHSQQSAAVLAAALARYQMLEELVIFDRDGSPSRTMGYPVDFLSVALAGINRAAIRRLTISAGTPVGPAIQFREIVGTWTKLEALTLSNAGSVTDVFVQEVLLKLPFTTMVRELRLDGCHISDSCLAWIGLANKLEVLDLSGTDVSEKGLGLLYAPDAVTGYVSIRELHLNGCRRLRLLPEHLCTPWLRALHINDGGHHADGCFHAAPMLLSAFSLDVLMHRNAHPIILGAGDERIESPGPLIAQLERLSISGSGRDIPAARLAKLLRICSSKLTYLSVGGECRWRLTIAYAPTLPKSVSTP